jgi:hemoglobin-like flavoprotein
MVLSRGGVRTLSVVIARSSCDEAVPLARSDESRHHDIGQCDRAQLRTCCEDLTPSVYRRLFDAHPEAEAMFRTEGSDLVKGSMLALTIDAILDFAGNRTGPFRMIECEVVSHDAYGTPRQLFGEFFGIIADTLREILGADWSVEMDEAWQQLLTEIEGIVAGVDAPA